MRRRLPQGLAVVVGVIALTVACSADDTDTASTGGPPPQLGTVPHLLNMESQALPLEPYLLQPDQYAKLVLARQRMVLQCTKRSGFDIRLGGGSTDGEAMGTQSSMRYVDSPERVTKYGYHAPPTAADTEPEPRLSQAESVALSGTDGKGGCFAEVDAQLAKRGIVFHDAELVRTINVEGMQRSLNDPRLREAFALWSGCMKQKGYRYDTPLQASRDPQWEGATATSLEIDTAVADLACMTENNVVGVWFAVESAYQKQLIEKNFEKLEEIRTAIAHSVRTIDQLAAAG